MQDHSGKQKVDPALQDLVVVPEGSTDYICHVGATHDLHSIIYSGLIARGREGKQGRHTVFLTAVGLANRI